MFTVFKGVSPQVVEEIFMFRDAMPYQLRKQTNFETPSVHSDFSSTESINFRGPKIWESLSQEVKQLENFKNFRK